MASAPAPAAFAAPPVISGGTVSVVIVSQPGVRCVGEKFGIDAYVASVVQVQVFGQSVPLPRGNGQTARIQAVSADPAVASVSPSTAATAPGRGRRTARFIVTANQVGSTTITFSNTGGQGASATEQVEVRDCHYEVVLDGTWISFKGFSPVMEGKARVNVATAPNGSGFAGLGKLITNADPRRPLPGCTVRMIVSSASVLVAGVPDRRPGRIKFMVSLGDVQATTLVQCPGVDRTSSKLDLGKPASIPSIVVRTSTRKITKLVLPHFLDADGLVPGVLYVTIERVPN